MKKTLIAIALLSTYVSVVHAQSNVTIYGVLDEYVDIGNNGKSSIDRLQSGGIMGSRIGFRGTEDLGGGLKSVFVLETGFNADDGSLGQGGLLFGRQAYIGLGGDFGTLTLGRQYSGLFYTFVNYGLGGGLAWGNASNYFVDLSIMRLNNAINYVSPNMAGFTFRGIYSAGENAGQTKLGSTISAAGQYDAGPFSAGLSYLARSTTTSNTDKWTSAGVSYDFNLVKTALLYQRRRDDANVTKNDFYEVSATIPFQSSSLLLDYGHFKNKLIGGGDASAVSVRYDYYLSKRSTVYFGIAKIRNDANASFNINGAASTGAAVTPGNDPRSIVAGIRHTF